MMKAHFSDEMLPIEVCKGIQNNMETTTFARAGFRPALGNNPLTAPYSIEGSSSETGFAVQSIKRAIALKAGATFPVTAHQDHISKAPHQANGYTEHWTIYAGGDADKFDRSRALYEKISKINVSRERQIKAVDRLIVVPEGKREALKALICDHFTQRLDRLTQRFDRAGRALRGLQAKQKAHDNEDPLKAGVVIDAIFSGTFNALTGKFVPSAREQRQSA
jgi:hypothetical protein